MVDLRRDEAFRTLMQWKYEIARKSCPRGTEEDYDENNPWYRTIKDVELNGNMLLETVRKLAHGRRVTQEDVLFSPQMQLEAERFCIGPTNEDEHRDDLESGELVDLDNNWQRMDAAKRKKDVIDMMDHNEQILKRMREIREPNVVARFLQGDEEPLSPDDMGSCRSGPSSCAAVDPATENGSVTGSEIDEEETTRAKLQRMKGLGADYLAVPGHVAGARPTRALRSRAGSIQSDGDESDGRSDGLYSATVPSIILNDPPNDRMRAESSYFAGFEFEDPSLEKKPSQ